jgi:hypothetical protein
MRLRNTVGDCRGFAPKGEAINESFTPLRPVPGPPTAEREQRDQEKSAERATGTGLVRSSGQRPALNRKFRPGENKNRQPQCVMK